MQTVTTIGLDIAKSVFSGPRRRRGGECSYSPAAQATLRDDLLPEAIAVPGRYRSLRLVAPLVARTPGDWPLCASDAQAEKAPAAAWFSHGEQHLDQPTERAVGRRRGLLARGLERRLDLQNDPRGFHPVTTRSGCNRCMICGLGNG